MNNETAYAGQVYADNERALEVNEAALHCKRKPTRTRTLRAARRTT